MKTQFDKAKRKNPDVHSIITFNQMVIDGVLKTKSDINKCFKLVDKADYQRKDRDSLLEYAYKILAGKSKT